MAHTRWQCNYSVIDPQKPQIVGTDMESESGADEGVAFVGHAIALSSPVHY